MSHQFRSFRPFAEVWITQLRRLGGSFRIILGESREETGETIELDVSLRCEYYELKH